MRKSIAIAFVVLAIAAANAYAVGEARLTGTVVDPTGKPLADVKITVVAMEQKTFQEEFKSDAKGRFAIFLLTGTIPYKFIFQKEGFATYEEIIKLKLVPEKNERTFTLGTGVVAGGGGAPVADPAVAAYNAGVTLFNEGKDDEAEAKFLEAVTAKPDLSAGYSALTKIYARKKNWPTVIEYGTKALGYDPEDAGVLSLMVEAYDKTGDKAKAAEYRKKAPANPTWLFNEAAKMINAGKDKDAEPLLAQAVEADPEFAVAHYELGMLYVRLGDSPHAREHLNRYLELEPTGKDAPTAKEMLKYVQ